MIQASLKHLNTALTAAELRGASITFTRCSTDTRSLEPGALYIALCGERFDGHDFISQAEQQGAAALLVERWVDSALPQVRVPDTRVALGELATGWRSQFDVPVVAITGSNGKTTVKEMLAEIFRAACGANSAVLATQGNLNNDIGVPLTLFRLGAEHQYAVIEMGANHPGEIAQLTQMARPHVALITQCAPAHLAGFASIEGVAQAKGEIFQGLQGHNATAVIHQEETYTEYWRGLNTQHSILSFGLNTGDVFARQWHTEEGQQHFMLHSPQGQIPIQLPLLGQHNVTNALAAAACALACGCTLTQIQAGLSQMRAVKGRLQALTGTRDSLLIDDTYNANPTSLQAGLQVLAQCQAPRWLILGDMLELGEASEHYHAQAGQQAQAAGVDTLLATGEYSAATVQAFGHNAQHFAQQADLIRYAQQHLPAHAAVLIKGSRSLHMEKVVQALTSDKKDC